MHPQLQYIISAATITELLALFSATKCIVTFFKESNENIFRHA